MCTVEQINAIIEESKSLKIKLIKAQDYENAAALRDIEKQYIDKKVK